MQMRSLPPELIPGNRVYEKVAGINSDESVYQNGLDKEVIYKNNSINMTTSYPSPDGQYSYAPTPENFLDVYSVSGVERNRSKSNKANKNDFSASHDFPAYKQGLQGLQTSMQSSQRHQIPTSMQSEEHHQIPIQQNEIEIEEQIIDAQINENRNTHIPPPIPSIIGSSIHQESHQPIFSRYGPQNPQQSTFYQQQIPNLDLRPVSDIPIQKPPLTSHQLPNYPPQSIIPDIAPISQTKWWEIFPTVLSSPPQMTASELFQLLNDPSKLAGQDFLIVDVRRTDFEDYAIPTSINLPAQSLYPLLDGIIRAIGHIPLVIFTCGSSRGRGPRCAGWYQDALNRNDLPSIAYVLEGGIKGWQKNYKDHIIHLVS